ncbi:MAG: hypothetical protein ACNA8W_23355, partial [Bradymonadaceae bacterium]
MQTSDRSPAPVRVWLSWARNPWRSVSASTGETSSRFHSSPMPRITL